MRAFYDSAPYAMGICELLDDDIRIISCNASMAALYQRPLAEIIGRTTGALGGSAKGRAFVVDGSSYFNRSGPRVADGIELLARLLHPDRFPDVPIAGRAASWTPA